MTTTSPDLSKFRPLSKSMLERVKDAADETKRLVELETNYLPENRNESYITYLRNHLRMLENEIEISSR